MSDKDNPSGLLSKVAKFVRSPTTNWADLDRQEPEQEQGYSKQALKEMIERKRQNDFVRKREFDQLRKLRQRGPGAVNPDLARPSFFQTSMPANSDERAMTIKKIDEIEAQMSNQWWQGKQQTRTDTGKFGESAPQAAPVSPPPTAPPSTSASRSKHDLLDDAYAPTRLAPMREDAVHMEGQDFPPTFPPTRPNSTFGRYAGASSLPTPSQIELPSVSEPSGPDLPPTRASAAPPPPLARAVFAHSQPFAVEMVQGASDPELEEAAIRFANGDNAGAEAGLTAALQGRNLRREQIDGWNAALFDLYRATGQQENFDAAAIAYAEAHGRSAPAWFSMPERLRSQGGAVRTQPTQLNEEPTWRCPPLLDREALDALQLAAANAARWYLDWSGLQRLAPDAIAPLAQIFAEWADTAVQLRFAGTDRLEQALLSLAPSGDRSVDRSHWQLRLDALRVMRQQDAFELAALDYCVTYEVSPPPWQDARCGFYRDPDATSAAGEVSVLDGTTSTGALPWSSSAMELDSDTPVVELAGEILGEATDALARLEKARGDAERMVVTCANLIRVDFSAAGSLLNWAATRQADGCALQFREVHRLVAAFFHVIGIDEHARVVVRTG